MVPGAKEVLNRGPFSSKLEMLIVLLPGSKKVIERVIFWFEG